jgi:hypothetical protein
MAGITQPLHPHLFRHQMLTYLTSKGPPDAQIQLISGHESKKEPRVIWHTSPENADRFRPSPAEASSVHFWGGMRRKRAIKIRGLPTPVTRIDR